MKLTDLLPNAIYENNEGEVAILKEMDGKGSVYVKILKEKDGKYERVGVGQRRFLVKFHTSMFVSFWRPMDQNQATA